MTDVLKKAKEIKEEIGEITFENVKAYIESLGYDVIEFNTVKGDEMLKDFGLLNEKEDCNGRTIGTTEVDIVMVDGNLSEDDKLYILLHELGHITLHLPVWAIIKKTYSPIKRECEAEAFAYALFHGESEV